MSWKDKAGGYGTLSIALHWVGAVAVAALFVLGQRIEAMPQGPEMIAARQLHVAVGAIAFGFLAARVAWRVANPVAHATSASPTLDRLAGLVQVGLVAAIAVLIVSGPLSVWSNGRGIAIFDLVTLPSPMPKVEWLHEAAELVHGVAAKVVLVLTVLHVLGALKHLIVDRDGVVRRMLVPMR